MSQLATAQQSITTLGSSVRRRVALVALVALCAVAVVLIVTLPGNETDGAQSAAPAVQSQSVAPGARFDGGPDEGTRGSGSVAPGTRFDGGPDEGSRGSVR
ncbi:MAG TPA: hypothetical protein VNB64_02065 [Solirubrobacteraceae bacterium]|nr:hypothetical protein [Solirubrobacteraceae bacterium]